MKKEKEFVFLHIPALIIALILSTAAAGFFHAMRVIWVFYDPYLRFIGGAMGFFIVELAVIAAITTLLALRLFKKAENGVPYRGGKPCRIIAAVSFVLSVFFALAVIVILFVAGPETDSVIFLYLKKDLPVILMFAAAVLLLLVLPALKTKAKAVLSVCAAVCFAAVFLWQIFPVKNYRIVSEPVVMDTGSDYAVVFATNDKGTGYVSYEFGSEEYKVYSRINGRRVGDRLIHTVHIPYEHLKNNSYTIGSTRVIEEFSYGSRAGKTVESGPYTLRVNDGEVQTYLVISDWHSYLKEAKAAISNFDGYDALIMMGDPSAGMDFEEQAVKNIVQFGGELTGGGMPVIYVRGNHETRGAFADELPSYLGYDKLYYTVDRGDYSFIVLDSGEDKPDDHIEYGGMDDYAVNRAEMINWLQELKATNDKTIVLSHAWQVSEPEPELSAAAWDAFDKLGARFVISGHIHSCEFIDGDTDEEREYTQAHPGITTYIDGGHSGKQYTASRITLSEQNVRFEAVDNHGNTVIDETYEW